VIKTLEVHETFSKCTKLVNTASKHTSCSDCAEVLERSNTAQQLLSITNRLTRS
jgi:hypothetical protein